MKTKKIDFSRAIMGLIVLVFAIFCAFPFYIIVVSSFTSEQTIITEGYGLTIRDFSVEAYALCFKNPVQIVAVPME